MTKYNFSFEGRTAGAIGITYQISKTYETAALPEAIDKLYKEYDLLRNIWVNSKRLPFDAIKFDKNNKCIAPNMQDLK